ncbi:MAG: hypothetical protein MSH60_09080 [Ruminococcus sp.]|nr:hypothetical protein [Ruminococcus sp.]
MSVDVEKIMSEIHGDIEKNQIGSGLISFEESEKLMPREEERQSDLPFDNDYLCERIRCMQASSRIDPDPPITGNKLSVLVKRFVRKLTQFRIKPVIDVQNQCNLETLRVFTEIEKYIDENTNQNTVELYKAVCMMELKLKNANMQIEELNRRLERLEKEKS